MKHFVLRALTILGLLAGCLGGCTYGPASSAQPVVAPGIRIELKDGWQLQSSTKTNEKGETISTTAFQPKNWYDVTVPATVIAGMLQNNAFPDPFVGDNLKVINPQSFNPSWWYRTEFSLPAGEAGKKVWLNFLGINYRANIWLNGVQIADDKQVVGAFREYRFDITDRLVAGDGPNVLAVEVFKPKPTDLAITFVDWNPAPPDGNMGLFNEVYLSTSGPVTVQHPLVATQFDLPALDVAHLTVAAEVTNGGSQPVTGTLEGTIENIIFSQEVTLAAGETRAVTFDPKTYPQLNLANPRLWWPWQYGRQEMYDLKLEFRIDGAVSDTLTDRFGIRQVTTEMRDGNTIFLVNGKRILIRGAAWNPDMFQRRSAERQEAEFRYVRDMNLNAIRLEGKFEDEHFFDLADENGILIIEGWCCCDTWESPGSWGDEQRMVANESLKTQLYRLRSHPSLLVWMNGSDMPPSVGAYDPYVGDPKVEQGYLDIEAQLQWPNPVLSNASEKASTITGETGVKMLGPYEWVPPIYWETDEDRQAGGAWSFATEISPGPAVPPLDSLEQMLGSDHLWPMDETWIYHTGGGPFHSLEVFTAAMNARYGPARSVADYAEKSQIMAYESHRAMFEAYGANKYTSTGVIQWMLNNAWPSMIWHLYDNYLRPGGSYFGAKIALEPLHIQYSYANNAVVVVNSTLQAYPDLSATADIYDLDGKKLYTAAQTVSVDADGVAEVLSLEEAGELPVTYLLRLTLAGADGQVASQNTYWLSTSPEAVDWDNTDWYVTPTSSYADFTTLQSVAPATLSVSDTTEKQDPDQVQTVTVTNTGTTVAYFVHLKVTQGEGGAEVLPALWQDNYFILLPGESRTITVRYRLSDLGDATPLIVVDTWNDLNAK